MSDLKEKTLESLRKIASRNKIEGRSSMKKSQLIRVLSNLTPKKSSKKTSKRSSKKTSKRSSKKRSMKGGKRSSKKTSKRSSKKSKKVIMKGGALTQDQFDTLVARNYQTNPMVLRYVARDGTFETFQDQITRIVMENGRERIYSRGTGLGNVPNTWGLENLNLSDSNNNADTFLFVDLYTNRRLAGQLPPVQLVMHGGKKRSKKNI